MFERDYIQRLIQQTARFMGQLMGLKEQNKHEQALEAIDDYLTRELRLKTRMAMGLSDDALLRMLTVGGVPNAESVAIIAAFLQEEAELLEELGRTGESVPRFEKSLRLHLYLIRENGGFDGWDVGERVHRLLTSLAPYEWEAETKDAVWRWHEAEGRFAEAENVLYELLATGEIVHGEGAAFYERLSRKSDEVLAAGGLPRSELTEGALQWAGSKKEKMG